MRKHVDRLRGLCWGYAFSFTRSYEFIDADVFVPRCRNIVVRTSAFRLNVLVDRTHEIYVFVPEF